MPNIDELKQKQALPLKAKVTLTKRRLQEWYDAWEGNIVINFSGGKDSTVLLNIAREVYPNIKAVFVDTGLEFPELKQHVKSFENVDIIRPELSFKQVIDKYGWVYPSKDVADAIYYARKGSKWAINKLEGKNKDGTESMFKARYKKWKFLLDAPCIISSKCCKIMKEKPLDTYTKNRLKNVVATMADESDRRTQAWLKTGCNAFSAKRPISKPMSFWVEQDVLQYIVDNNIKIPSVYGDIIKENGRYKTTGETRTGCIFCPVSCHLDKPTKIQRLKETHPKLYDYCLNQLNMKELLDYVGNHLRKQLY